MVRAKSRIGAVIRNPIKSQSWRRSQKLHQRSKPESATWVRVRKQEQGIVTGTGRRRGYRNQASRQGLGLGVWAATGLVTSYSDKR